MERNWVVPYNKLDDEQKRFIQYNMDRESIWIKGFPGSGKSVLLSYVAKKALDEGNSVLMVVFTRSLIEMYREAFEEMGMHGVDVVTYYEFENSKRHYDYILCDEVQDLYADVIEEMKDRCAHLFVGGDENQSIYEEDPKWGNSTVDPNDIEELIDDYSPYTLTTIHRLSPSIISAVDKLMPGMGLFSAKKDMNRNDTQIRLCEATSKKKEVEYIMRDANKAVSKGVSSAILLPTHKDIKNFVDFALESEGVEGVEEGRERVSDYRTLNRHFRDNGVKLQYVGNGYGTFSDSDHRAVIMTYHSAKGLDFDRVYIPFVNSSLFIPGSASKKKTIFMVAMTRPRGDLFITYTGSPNSYVNTFESTCSHIDIASNMSTATSIRTSGSSSRKTNPFGI